MSKYYKAEDVINTIEYKIAEYIPTLYGRYAEIPLELRMAIEHLPTIEVSEDCISREYLKSFEYINKGDFNSIETIREWIDNAPSVVPSRAEGKWVKQGLSPYEGVQRCSLCGSVYNITEDLNYCPNCEGKEKIKE